MTGTDNESILEVEQLKTYFFLSRGIVKAVDDVSFTVKKGQVMGLVGESGCGKSMTCMSIMGLLPPAARIVSGKINFDGVNLANQSQKYMRMLRGRMISMILQDPSTSLNPVYTIGNQMEEAIKVRYNYRGTKLRSTVIDWLDAMRLPAPEKRLHDYPHHLSGGMKQRVAGAMALSVMPKLLIADEPTTALDVTIQAQYLQEIKKLQMKLDLSCIFITHDLSIIGAICDRLCIMYAGNIVEQIDVSDLFRNHRHPYTQGLLQCLPSLDERVEKLAMIPGEPPSLLNLPEGCRFYPRCPKSRPHCREQTPPTKEISKGHLVRCWEVS